MELLANAIKLPPSTGASSAGIREAKYQCPICQDRGIVMVGGDLADICKCMAQRKLEKLMKSSQITPAFRAKTFQNFDIKEKPGVIQAMYGCAKDYADRFEEIRQTENNWLVYLGEPGSGKTHLTMAVANLLLAQNIGVLYFPHVEGIKELLKSFHDKEESKINIKIDQMKKAPVLIWDDLWKGRERPIDWVMELVFEVINYRYHNLLPTFISSERVDYQLIEIDMGIGSRILERGKGHTVVVEGQEHNYRLN